MCFPWCYGHLDHLWETSADTWAAGLAMSICPDDVLEVASWWWWGRARISWGCCCPQHGKRASYIPHLSYVLKMHDQMRLCYVSWQLVELMSSPWIESDSIVTLSEWRLTQCQPMTGQPVLRNRRGPVWMLEETRRPFLGAGGRCQGVPNLREEGGGYEGRIRIFLASEKGFCLLSMRLAVTIWWDWHGMGGLGIPVGCMNSHTCHPKSIFPYLNRC